MAYVHTGGMSTVARRRRRRAGLVLSGLALMLAVVLFVAIAFYQGWWGEDDARTTDSDEATSTAPALQPKDVIVNVYNANGEAGLAGRVADELEDRDFGVDAIDNDPQDATIEHAANIRHGPDGLLAAEFLQESVPGSKLVADDRAGADIDLVLGNEFDSLAEEP